MNSERRTSIRKKIPRSVLINYVLARSKRWKIRDLRLDGALADMDENDPVPGAPMEAVLALQEHHEYDDRLPAEVIRVLKNWVALQFGNYDGGAYIALVNPLYGA